MPAKKTATLKSLQGSTSIKTMAVEAGLMDPTPTYDTSIHAAGSSCGCGGGEGTCVGCDGRCKCKTLFGCHFLGMLKQKKVIAGVFASFFILWLGQFITHGNLLMPLYNRTPELWLTTEQMSLPAILLANLTLSIIIPILFFLAQKFGTYWEGLRLGKLLFVPLAVGVAYQWATRPLPTDIAIYWGLEFLVEGALIGLALTAIGNCHCFHGKWFGACGKNKPHHHHGGGCC